VSELRGHELRWHKVSKKDGSGKCDIVSSDTPDASVFGVLYEIANAEKSALDEAEGKGFGYEEIDIDVSCDHRSVRAKAYRATNTNATLKPYTWYHALVIAGAREHGLPASYVAGLERVAVNEDADRARHDENMSLIAGVQA
jgi:hypothetical protein